MNDRPDAEAFVAHIRTHLQHVPKFHAIPSIVPADQPSDTIIAEALSRARGVYDGGAYTAIFHSATPQQYGPFTGVTVAVKDLMAVAGYRIGAGSKLRQDAPLEARHATLVAQLVGAGATLIGLTSLHEFAFGVTGINDFSGTTVNPHDALRIAGGSSTGSAVAVAERSAQIAIGTDTGGSVRLPAALCGVVGFKPAYDTYSRDGVFPLAPSLDHMGLLARSVEEIQAVHSLVACPTYGQVQPLRVGVIRAEIERAESSIQTQFDSLIQALSAYGCQLVDVTLPDYRQVSATATTITFSEAAHVHQTYLERMDDYGVDVRGWLQRGLMVRAIDYLAALDLRHQIRAEMQALLMGVDCTIGPTVQMVAPTFAALEADPTLGGKLIAYTRLANVAGLPAISIPMPTEGLPIGLQLMALDNERLLQLAAFIARRVFG
ncbi:MAG: amidase [Anaerolineales bacterium]|nr:amidase [Anaerolineales bacterium]